jgi:riboflavin kinase
MRTTALRVSRRYAGSKRFFGRGSSMLHSARPGEDRIVKQQKSVSDANNEGVGFKTEVAFVRHQRKVFDDMADTFSSGELVTDELVPVYEDMTKRMLQGQNSDSETIAILDVACGSGVLWPFLAKAAEKRLQIFGVDLSENMVAAAAARADELFEVYLFEKHRHSFAVVESDIVEYENPDANFDLIILNACFGNFWKPVEVLKHLCTLTNSTIVVSHPLGKSFVERLHKADPSTVPHLLPASESEWNDLLLTVPLELTELVDDGLFLARLKRVRARGLPKTVRLRGPVDTGYGRGGKKLGFPTANLPSRLFQDALGDVDTGVYFGFVSIEGRDNKIYKAVVNVGFSPTFQGKENKEKIVEAHLMVEDEELKDFYGETIRLQLTGFLRREIKFPSFPDLIAQINADVIDAKDSLDKAPYATFKSDDFLDTSKPWTGEGGGNEEASWEFQKIREALEGLPKL